jgi:predicted RNA-binding protein
MAIARKITLGAEIFLNQQATDSQSTWFFKNETVATAAGAQTLKVGAESYATVHPLDNNVQHHYFDDLVVARSGLILVQQLAEDWTARLYDAADVLIAEAEEDGGTATLDVEDEAYPITGRIKLYNASDELEYAGELRTDHYGGDEWIQFSIETMLTVSVDNYIINKTGEAAPTTATITFTLKDGAGDPIVGNTITFTTSHGDLDPESDETDVNGQVSTELTADTMGLAIVKAVWAGDETYPRSFETVEVSVHDAEDDPDELAEYDVWIQGKKISGCGPIVISSSPGEHLAEFEIPEIDSDVKGLYDFAIYRYGTCVFFGRIETLSMIISPMPIMKVQGRSMIRTLMRTQIDSLVVTDTLKNIIDQVYDDFLEPRKQVLLGTLSDSLDVVSVTVNGEDLIAFDVISRMAALGGATLSVDASRQINVM